MLSKGTWISAALYLFAASADVAFASSEAEGEVSLFEGDFGNAVWTLLIFLLVLIVLGRFAWGPILKGLQNREKFIRDSLADAKNEREEAKRTLAEYTEKLEKSRQEATAIVDEGRRDSEEVRKRILAEAKVEAQGVAARAKKEIEMARDDAVKQLYDETVLLATSVAGRIIHKELSPGDHQELVDQALKDMGRLN
ncbi:MAG: F0F1 ATP synthase subunit B [Phycisphaerae bacterium]|nr:F0F1 ATP synthase subunit B [Phycisphaerae bacterium]